MLDGVFGSDRFDRGPVDMRELALGYSGRNPSEEPIVLVEGRPLQGIAGALLPSAGHPRRWAIVYDSRQSEGRRNFTIGHEFGHYVLHRDLLGPDGIRCGDEAVLHRDGQGIEKEADEFAAAVLMPLHDLRRRIDPAGVPSFEELAALADRYGVSFTAAILRWLEFTDRRSVLVLSNEGFAHWAQSSKPAFRSGRFIRTKNAAFELPATSTAATRDFSDLAKKGIWRDEGIWFPEPVLEMCVRSDRYDLEFTLLHLEPGDVRPRHEEEAFEDVYDRIAGQARSVSNIR